MKLNNNIIKSLALVVVGGVLLNWLLNNFEIIGTFISIIWGLILPFVIGFMIAFILNMPMRFIENKFFRGKMSPLKRLLSFLISLILLLSVVGLIIGIAVPQLWATVVLLTESMPGYIARIEQDLAKYYQYIPEIQVWIESLDLDWGKMFESFTAFLTSGASDFFTSTISIATSIAGGIFTSLISVVFACYLLFGKEHLIAQIKGVLQAYIPQEKYLKIKDVASLTSRTFSNFISGQCLEAVLLSLGYLLILSVGGFDYALLISVVVGFFSLIPLVGAYIGCAVGVFLLLVSMGFWRALAFVIIMIIVQQVEGNIIYPRVLGSSVGLPPVGMLVAVTIGGGVAGIFGMIFFIPLFSVIYILIRKDVTTKLEEKGVENPVHALTEKTKHHKKWRHKLSKYENKRPAPEETEETNSTNTKGE